MVAVPPDTPVTTPVGLTVAVPVLLHVPPAGVQVIVAVRPTHTLVGPTIAETVGNGFTVITAVAKTVPQLLLTT